MSTQISDEDYILIIKNIGYPVIKENDIEYSKDEILALFVKPAIMEYFIWFPIIEEQSIRVSSCNAKIPFPENKYVYGVSGIRFSSGYTGLQRSVSPFVNSVNYKQSVRPYESPYDYGLEESRYLDRVYKLTQMENIRAIDYNVDENNRIVNVISNDTGELIVSWSKWSENFNDIPFKRQREVIELASGRLMVDVANLESRIETGTGVTLNTDGIKSDGEKKIENVMNKWKAMSKAVIQR